MWSLVRAAATLSLSLSLSLSLAILIVASPVGAQGRRRGTTTRRDTVTEEAREGVSARDAEEARRLFAAGMTAIDQGLWADALGSFQRAYELTRVPSALRNVALALRALGRHRAARDAFAQLLRDHALDPTTRHDVETLRDEEIARLAVLEVAGLELQPGALLRLDGEPLTDDGARPLRVEVDPATHVLVAEREGYERFVWQGELLEGGRRRVELVLRPIGAPGDDTLLHVLLVASAIVAVGVAASVVGWWAWNEERLQPSYPQRFTL
jgi:tetratricopeptide (TPR) repeat protein